MATSSATSLRRSRLYPVQSDFIWSGMCFSTESKLPPPRYTVAWGTFSMIRKMILSRKIPQKPFSFRWKYGRISGNLQKAMGYYGSERKNKGNTAQKSRRDTARSDIIKTWINR